MDAAKQAINKLTSKHGHHTTEIHEHYRPAVTHEQINPTRQHEDTTVIDKEVHHDHHHTSVLPVKDQEVLPTEHSHNIVGTKHTESHHGDHKGVLSKVAAEVEQFKDSREVAATEKTHTVAPTVGSEHHHHIVHETIQPIVQKQTVQPSVVHTTIPVHEVHHNEPKHYTASALPAVSLQDFKSQGGSLTGLEDRVERFEGEPESIAHHHGHGNSGIGSNTGSSSTRRELADETRSGNTTTGGLGNNSSTYDSSTSQGLRDGNRTGTTGNSYDNNTSTGLNDTSRSGIGGSRSGVTGDSYDAVNDSSRTGTGSETSRAQQFIDSRDGRTGHGVGSNTTSGTTGNFGTTAGGTRASGNNTNLSSTTHHDNAEVGKPSLLDRINPFKDSDHDGKKGMMD